MTDQKMPDNFSFLCDQDFYTSYKNKEIYKPEYLKDFEKQHEERVTEILEKPIVLQKDAKSWLRDHPEYAIAEQHDGRVIRHLKSDPKKRRRTDPSDDENDESLMSTIGSNFKNSSKFEKLLETEAPTKNRFLLTENAKNFKEKITKFLIHNHKLNLLAERYSFLINSPDGEKILSKNFKIDNDSSKQLVSQLNLDQRLFIYRNYQLFELKSPEDEKMLKNKRKVEKFRERYNTISDLLVSERQNYKNFCSKIVGHLLNNNLLNYSPLGSQNFYDTGTQLNNVYLPLLVEEFFSDYFQQKIDSTRQSFPNFYKVLNSSNLDSMLVNQVKSVSIESKSLKINSSASIPDLEFYNLSENLRTFLNRLCIYVVGSWFHAIF